MGKIYTIDEITAAVKPIAENTELIRYGCSVPMPGVKLRKKRC